MLDCLARLNEYDGVEEFWVTIRESGNKTDSLTQEERQRNSKQAAYHETN